MINRHILLVDDTKSLAHMYMHALETEGYHVTVAHSGAGLFNILSHDSFTQP